MISRSVVTPIKIILLDDHTVIHQLLTDLVATIEDMVLVGQGTNGTEAAALYGRHRPDIVLMDIVMPQLDGIGATRALLSAHPTARVLALSSFQDERSVFDMLTAGAIGYLLKTNLSDELIPTLRAIHSGGKVLSAPIAAMLTALKAPATPVVTDSFHLTPREIEVLRQLATGQTNAEVADVLNITTPTVRYHINNIMEKMGVPTRTEAIVLAVRHQII